MERASLNPLEPATAPMGAKLAVNLRALGRFLRRAFQKLDHRLRDSFPLFTGCAKRNFFGAGFGRPHRWFEEVLSCMPLGVLLADPRTGTTFFSNREARRMLGRESESGHQEIPPGITDSSGKQIAWTELAAILQASGKPLKNYETIWHRGGEELVLLVQGELLSAMHGHPAAALLCFLDISEQKRIEAKLRESEERFRLLSEAMPQIVWAASPDGSASYFNDRWYQFTGLSFEESKNHGWESVIHPDDLNPFWEKFCRAAATGETFTHEERKRRHDGSYAWHLTRGVPVRNKEGEVVLLVGTCTDIQAQKETENKLRESQELRNRFTNALTHDLRNPLSAAKMAAQMLLRYDLGEDGKQRMCFKLVESLDRAERMISDLLDANRIQAGKQIALKLEPFSLNLLIEKTIEDLSLTHGSRFRLLADETIEGYWSRDGLRRVLENLLTNAVKYGYEHTPITIKLRRLSGGSVEFSVHNFGRVLAEEERTSLFDIFSRAPSAQSGGQQGWGIGLTLVKGIAEAHTGSVRVESEAAAGTTFSVVLPLDARQAPGFSERTAA